MIVWVSLRMHSLDTCTLASTAFAHLCRSVRSDGYFVHLTSTLQHSLFPHGVIKDKQSEPASRPRVITSTSIFAPVLW